MSESEVTDPVPVRLVGVLDYRCDVELRRLIGQAVEQCAGSVVEVDLAAVTSIDSDGVGSLLYCQERARRFGASLVLRNVSPRVAEIFGRAGAAGLLPVQGTAARRIP